EDGLNLWESTRPTLNDPWGTPKELDAGINSDFYEMWPCLSFDGLTLLFSTWRPDSIGGYDLYRSTRKSKEEPWSAPVNLGSEINTPANESGPCLSRTGQELIYMSNRSGGEGGVDLWISKRVDDQWSKPQLIGGKINSDLDDFDARLCMNDNVLVFNRNDLGGTTGITTWIAARKDANSSWSNPKEIPFLSRIHAQSVNLLPSSNKEIVFSSHKYSTDQDVRRFRLVSKQGATPTAESERHSASYSLEFDGVDDYVEVDMRRFILNTKQTITVEGWFWIDEVSEKTQSVVRLSNSVLGPEFRILVDPKKSGGRINASWAIRSDPASAKPEFRWHDSYANLSESLGKWVHIAATFQRGVRNPSLYVNGQVSSVRDAGLYIFKEHEVL
ncbi:MAG: LamG domain-containing protein, partial [Planctomycetaceae bacterium]|nr:LamG domain-containing protein [Planctomycetaceae bacterium]